MTTKTLQPQKNWRAWKVMPGIKISTLLLLAILALAAFLHFYNLEVVGDCNLYYTAAIESMLQSWENFFFVAAEPGGSIGMGIVTETFEDRRVAVRASQCHAWRHHQGRTDAIGARGKVDDPAVAGCGQGDPVIMRSAKSSQPVFRAEV
mgnify:CR=1 FL=1